MSEYKIFQPDLIVEATNACNLDCKGCYSANLLIGNAKNKEKIRNLNPIGFEDRLKTVINLEGKDNPIITFRGGEPSLAPDIDKLIFIASRYSNNVFLESNGLWLLDSGGKFNKLLNSIIKTSSILKLSFDKMHNSKPQLVSKIIKKARDFNIDLSFGVTAKSEDEFLFIVDDLSLPGDVTTYYQEFAKDVLELKAPGLGVIKQDAKLYERL